MKKRGFTLIELIVVIAIIGILTGLAVPSVKIRMKMNSENEKISHEQMINKALRQYYALEGKYPDDILILESKKFGPKLDNKKYKYNYDKNTKEVQVTLNEEKK